MSNRDDEMLKSHVLHIVKSIEEGYYSKDNCEIREDENGFYICNIETDQILDDEFFKTEKEAQDYLEGSPGFMVSPYDYLQDALDIEYVCNSQREYLGARVLVAFGGPNIWINTRTKQVEGYWWGSQCIWGYTNDAMGLDDALNDLFNC